jgi:hypothetical protein
MIRRTARLLACSPLLLAAAACGSSSSGPDAPAPGPSPSPTAAPTEAPAPTASAAPVVDNGAPSTTYPAPHPPLPVLVNQAGGKVLVAPKVFLVVYPGYTHTAGVQSFAQALGTSAYWTATTKEYGIGAIEYAGTKELTGETAPATITDTDVQAFIAAKIASGDLGAPDPNTLYAIFYPETTTITLSGGGIGGGSSCTSFGGYHGDVAVSVSGKSADYAFAVLPTCASFGGLAGIDALTGAASHELVEAVTDPFPSTKNGAESAYSSVDSDHFIWVLAGGTEAGDLCVPETDAFQKLPGLDFTVQRTWSNASAKLGHDPCVPAMKDPYFQSAPVLTETVTLTLPASFGGSDVTTKGVTIPIGKSKTIEIDLFSDAATSGPWTVSAEDALGSLGGGKTLDFAWDRTKGLNGEKLHLTISVKGASSFVPGSHPFTIVSTLGAKKATWPGLVVDN